MNVEVVGIDHQGIIMCFQQTSNNKAMFPLDAKLHQDVAEDGRRGVQRLAFRPFLLFLLCSYMYRFNQY